MGSMAAMSSIERVLERHGDSLRAELLKQAKGGLVMDIDSFFATFFGAAEKLHKILNHRKYRRWFEALWRSGAGPYEFYELARRSV